MNPSAIPVEILDVNGIDKMTKKAGNASSMPFQSMSFTALIIKLPTIINAGDVMAATPEIDVTNGLKNDAMINSTPTVTDVKPVRPPAATPDDDSMKAVVGLVPTIAPAVVATESAKSAARAFFNLPSFIKPACFATPIIVPVVSNNVTKRNENTTPYKP